MIKLIVSLLLLLPLAVSADAQILVGRWIVTRYLNATELSAPPTTLNTHIGKALVVSAKSVEFDDESCAIDKTYRIATNAKARDFFLHDYKADYAVLKLKAPILVVETDCNIVISDSRHRVVFDWSGDFFEAKAAQETTR